MDWFLQYFSHLSDTLSRMYVYNLYLHHPLTYLYHPDVLYHHSNH